MEAKAIISLIVVVLTILGYAPYISDILKGKTKPHILTWLSGSVTTFTAFFLQITGGAGVGAWAMLTVAVISTTIFLLSFKYGTKDIIKVDVYFLLLSFVALFMWLVINQPVMGIILITAAQVFAYLPTVRKSWKDPYSETLVFYKISTMKHGLAVVALEKINILTALYPVAWVLVNLAVTLILISRRKTLTSK